MDVKTALGLVVFVIGIAMIPFGHWVARIYYYGGLFLATLGAVLAMSSWRTYKKKLDDWVPRNDPEIPIVGEARGFHGSKVFDRPDTGEREDGAGD